MPEIVNGITVPVEGDPVDLPGDLRTFAEDMGAAAETIAAEAGAAAATEIAVAPVDAQMATVAGNPASAFAAVQSASYAGTPDLGTEVGPGARAVGKGELVVNVADYRTPLGLVDLDAVVQAMEEMNAACYTPPGEWYLLTKGVVLNDTHVPTLVASTPNRFTYKFFGAGRHSRWRLAVMGDGEFQLVANSTDVDDFRSHPKVIFEDMAITGVPGSSQNGGFFQSHQRSFRASRLYFSVMKHPLWADGYCDVIHVDQIHAEAMTPGGCVLTAIGNGDGVVIRQLFAFDTHAINLRGSFGVLVEASVGGYYTFESCGVTLRDNHMEGEGTSITDPVVTFKGCTARVQGGFYQTKKFRPTFQINDYVDSLVSDITINHDVVFAQRLDDVGSTLGNVRGTDIDIVKLNKRSQIHLDRCESYQFHQSTATGGGGNGFGNGGMLGLKITATGHADVQTALDARSRILQARRSVIRFTRNAWAIAPDENDDVTLVTTLVDIAAGAATSGDLPLSSYEAYCTTDLTPGTYYYRVDTVDIAGRATDAMAELSFTSTSGHPLIPLTLNTMVAPLLLRIRRGTVSGTYTHWVELLVTRERQTFIDQGTSIAGVQWSTVGVPSFTTNGGAGETRRGELRLDGSPGWHYASAAPVGATWPRGYTVRNSQPSASGPAGWMCVTAGTPGTWKAMANLAA